MSRFDCYLATTPLCQLMWMDFTVSYQQSLSYHTCVYMYILFIITKRLITTIIPRSRIVSILFTALTYHSTCITIINTHLVMLPIYRSGNRQCGTNQFLIYNRISTYILCIVFTFMENAFPFITITHLLTHSPTVFIHLFKCSGIHNCFQILSAGF